MKYKKNELHNLVSNHLKNLKSCDLEEFGPEVASIIGMMKAIFREAFKEVKVDAEEGMALFEKMIRDYEAVWIKGLNKGDDDGK